MSGGPRLVGVGGGDGSEHKAFGCWRNGDFCALFSTLKKEKCSQSVFFVGSFVSL